MAGSVAYLDVAVGPYLQQHFDIGGDTAGYYFLSFSLAFILGSFLTGLVVNRGHGCRVFVVVSFVAGASFWALALPGLLPQIESPLWLIAGMSVFGLLCSGCNFTSQLTYEAIAYKLGYEDLSVIRIHTGALTCAAFYFGRITGSTLAGGYFLQQLGYYWGCFLQGSLFFLTGSCVLLPVFKYQLLDEFHYRTT